MIFCIKNRPAAASGEQGFTLLEVAISILIIGVLFSGATLAVAQYVKAQEVAATQDKIALIENALSSYAQQHYRLPCPADPQGLTAAPGTEVDNGNCFKNNATNAGLYWETEGIVPWKELGIPQDMALDAWGRYITYKPIPQLTVNNLSTYMQDTSNIDGTNDVHNACRTAMWYDGYGNHVNRAKALFCCNAAPKAAYVSHNGLTPLTVNPDWQQNGVVDTTTAKATATGGNSMPAKTPVAMTGNWMDASTAAVHGAFTEINSSQPEPPLMRASGLAVTLISHGPRGTLAFLPEQKKTVLYGGAKLNTASGKITTSGIPAPAVERDNVWPPHIFDGVFGHPKVDDGSYNPLGNGQKASDDIVVYLRSDDLYGRIGQASCEKPPSAVFKPVPGCMPVSLNPGSTANIPTISMEMTQAQGVPYIMKASATRVTDAASYNNSLGVYTIAADGSIGNVSMLTTDMHTMPVGQSTSSSSPLQNGMSVGTFELPNGGTVDAQYFAATRADGTPNPWQVDITKMQMVKGYSGGIGGTFQRAANITLDTGGVGVTLVAPVLSGPNAGKLVQIVGANGAGGAYIPSNLGDGVYNMNSTLNPDQISHDWRPDDSNPVTVVHNEGVDPTDNTKMDVAFEDESAISCYYTNSGACVGKAGSPPPKGSGPNDAALDQFGGYKAHVGDNDYDDVAVSMSVIACPPQN